MRKLLALGVLLALTAPAFAADNTLLVTPCASGCITTRSKDVGSGVEAPMPILSDTSGNPLTTAAAGADGVTNSVNGVDIWAFPMLFNGTTWDRWKGDATNGAFVNIKNSVTLNAAQSGTWNITNISGTVSLPTGAASATNQATEIASLATIASNTGAAIPGCGATPCANTTQSIGYVSDDPCTRYTKTNGTIATSSGTLQLVGPSGSTQVYLCSLSLIAAATAVVNVVGGTGATCTTGTPVAAFGSTTAASGASLAANGGLTFGNGGATVLRTTTAGHGLCVIQSGTTALAGSFTFVQQ